MTDFTARAIDAAQDKLEASMAKARAEDSKELASLVRDRGDRFVKILTGTMAMSRIHDLENRAFDQPIEELTSAIASLHELLGPIHVVLVEDQVYVNDIRIRFALDSRLPAQLNEIWNAHNTGGLRFHKPLSGPEWRLLVKQVSKEPAEEGARSTLQANLNRVGLEMLQLEPRYRFRHQHEKGTRIGADAKKAYSMSSGAVGSVWNDLAQGRSLNALPVRKAMSELADMEPGEQAREIADISRDAKRPAMTRHCVQVATLSLVIGRALGLSEEGLSDLGVAATLHDAGYGADEGGFPPPFERHATAGVRMMLEQRGFHEARIRRMLSTLQHHDAYDADPSPSLFARIIKIADDYDTLTRWRYSGPLAMPPFAVAKMASAVGALYDPVLFQLFVNQVGCFPPGSILEMSGGSWLSVISGVRSPELFEKPLCLLVRTADGKEPDFELKMDLAKGGDVARALDTYDLF